MTESKFKPPFFPSFDLEIVVLPLTFLKKQTGWSQYWDFPPYEKDPEPGTHLYGIFAYISGQSLW